MYPAVKSFARENPTMILTLCYVLITAIGTGYSFFFYREFGINIIKFADLSDFLLAAILEPLSLMLFALIIICIFLLYWLDVQFRKRFNFYRYFVEKGLMSKYSDPIIMLIIIVSFSFIFMRELAVDNANKIRVEGKDTYQVSLSEDDSAPTVKKLELLGSTSRFVYLYDPIKKQSVVISPENLNYMSKLVKQKEPVEKAE